MGFETDHTIIEARFLAAALRPGASVLEVGCGRKTRLRGFRGRISELVGVDLDVQAGAENEALDRFVEADVCRELPFEAESFDLVYANFVVEHLESPARAFVEWCRVLRPGGSIVLLASNSGNPLLAAMRLLPQRARERAKELGPGAERRDVFAAVYRANTPARLDELLRAAGLMPVEIRCVATLHRYAGPRTSLAALLRATERPLPEQRRSTIVAWYRKGPAAAPVTGAAR